MPRGYTRTSVRGCGRGAADLWSAVLREHDRRAATDQPWAIGELRQVFDRSAYLEFRPEAIHGFDPLGPPLVLLAGDGFEGPLVTRLAGSSHDPVRHTRLASGTHCRLRTAAGSDANPGYVVSLGQTMDIELETAALQPHDPQARRYPNIAAITHEGPVWTRAVDALDLLTEREIADGLGWLQELEGLVSGGSLLSEIQSLIEWWVDSIQGAAAEPPPIELLGRGPGATPSGDDILSGLLLALLRTTSRQRHDRVENAGRRIVAMAEERTTDISRALLAQAAQGRAGGRVEAALGALLAMETDEAGLEPPVIEAAALGHTSGTDHLVGVLLAILGIAPEIGEQP